MGRNQHRPLTTEEAKARLRQVARDQVGHNGDAAGALGREVGASVRRRPLAAVGIALAAGLAFGASRRVRSQVITLVLRALG